jgi:hypothetical protein
MEVVEKIEKVVKFSDSTFLNNFVITLLIAIASLTFYIVYKLLQEIKEDNINDYSAVVLPILIALIATTLAIFCRFNPTNVDKIFNYKVIEYQNNVDKDKYDLIIYTNENGKYVQFDNKGNDNIQLREKDTKIDNNMFKVIGENDKEYLIEYEVTKRYNQYSAVRENKTASLPKK